MLPMANPMFQWLFQTQVQKIMALRGKLQLKLSIYCYGIKGKRSVSAMQLFTAQQQTWFYFFKDYAGNLCLHCLCLSGTQKLCLSQQTWKHFQPLGSGHVRLTSSCAAAKLKHKLSLTLQPRIPTVVLRPSFPPVPFSFLLSPQVLLIDGRET